MPLRPLYPVWLHCVATGPVIEIFVADVVDGEADLAENRLARLVGRPATRANFAHQPLAQHALQTGGDEERLDAHVDQARHGAGRIVGVKRGEDEVAGERSLDGDLRRFQVARFPDHDAVRVLPQKGPQGARESQPDRLVDRHLLDALDFVLDRLLGREQLGIRRC